MTPGPSLEELYDDRTVAALEAWRAGRGTEPPVGRGRVGRGGLTGLAVGAIALGLRDVLEPEDERPQVVEFHPDEVVSAEGWVSFVCVPSAPHRSRIIVRPWMAPPF